MSCFFGHTWGKWEKTTDGKIIRDGTDADVVGYWIKQERICSRCGKHQIDVQTKYV
jgi:hypothetical protein